MSQTESPSTLIASDFITVSGTYFYLGADSPVSFGEPNPFTIEGWVSFDSLDAAIPILSRGGEIVLGRTDDRRIFVRRRFCDTPLVGETRLPPEAWHHVAVSSDGESLTLFIDCARDGEHRADDASGIPRNLGSLDWSASLGARVWNLRIWNRALSAEQLRQSMRLLVVPQNGLVASFLPEIPAEARVRLDAARKASAA